MKTFKLKSQTVVLDSITIGDHFASDRGLKVRELNSWLSKIGSEYIAYFPESNYEGFIGLYVNDKHPDYLFPLNYCVGLTRLKPYRIINIKIESAEYFYTYPELGSMSAEDFSTWIESPQCGIYFLSSEEAFKSIPREVVPVENLSNVMKSRVEMFFGDLNDFKVFYNLKHINSWEDKCHILPNFLFNLLYEL